MIPAHMAPFPKINTLYKRDDKGRILPGEFARPEFEVLYDIDWVWTEKVDGTNIRLGYNPNGGWHDVDTHVQFRGNESFWIAGRTNNAQIPPFLLERLVEIQRTTPYEDHFDGPVTLYGEGYGARIQNGGNYIPDGVDFVLFDVKVGDWWLDYDDVVDVARKLGLDVVRQHGQCGIGGAETMVRNDLVHSAWNGVRPEGLVGRPATTLFNKKGERILCKIKHVDYGRLEQGS